MNRVVDMRPVRWRAFFAACIAVGDGGPGGGRHGKLLETLAPAKALGAPARRPRDNRIFCSAQWAAEAWNEARGPLRAALQPSLGSLGRAGLMLIDGPPGPDPEASAQAVLEFDWQRRRDTGTD